MSHLTKSEEEILKGALDIHESLHNIFLKKEILRSISEVLGHPLSEEEIKSIANGSFDVNQVPGLSMGGRIKLECLLEEFAQEEVNGNEIGNETPSHDNEFPEDR